MTRVPSATVGRLVTYLRIVSAYAAREQEHITSSELASEAGVTAFLVRKDLHHLKDPDTPAASAAAADSNEAAKATGPDTSASADDLPESKNAAGGTSLGTRGEGYSVKQLKKRLWDRLGLTTPWHVAIVGMGRLGRAIADYPSLDQYNFKVRAGFDVDPSLTSNTADVTVHPMADLARVIRQERITIAFLTVPAGVAQEVANQLAGAGVRGILNFTPAVLDPPAGVHVESVDFMAGLKRLSYFLYAPGIEDEPASPG